MLEFLTETALQSIVCFLGFLAGILYERDRLKRGEQHSTNNKQKPTEFRAGKMWYRETLAKMFRTKFEPFTLT